MARRRRKVLTHQGLPPQQMNADHSFFVGRSVLENEGTRIRVLFSERKADHPVLNFLPPFSDSENNFLRSSHNVCTHSLGPFKIKRLRNL